MAATVFDAFSIVAVTIMLTVDRGAKICIHVSVPGSFHHLKHHGAGVDLKRSVVRTMRMVIVSGDEDIGVERPQKLGRLTDVIFVVRV